MINQYNRGNKIRTRDIETIYYLDDATLISENEHNLQRIFFEFHIACEQFTRTIFISKIKVSTIDKELLRYKWSTENKLLNHLCLLIFYKLKLLTVEF